MFLQIHTLTSYPASLLNRDDAGLAKRIQFGNAIRQRVSSQCLKRHWRETLQQDLPEIPDGLRTRHFFSRVILPRVLEAGIAEKQANELVETLTAALVKGGVSGVEMEQPVLFGTREADYFVNMILEVAKDQSGNPLRALKERLSSRDEKKNLEAMKSAAGLASALFGRMVTSDLLARVDAPVHVAHAITVHAANTEMDYFTVVDDLARDEETGAAHANQTELGAGVYYGYVAVDVPLLVSNLTGADAKKWREQDGALAQKILDALVRAIAEKSPGAKKGSTAPYSRAETVLLEVGPQQPRQLCNAFLDALSTRGQLLQTASARLAEQMKKLDAMYGQTADTRKLSTLYPDVNFGVPAQPLNDSIQSALDAVWSRA